MKEDYVTIKLESPTVNGKIDECRRKLDQMISILKRPPRKSRVVQDIELVKIVGNTITYKIFWRDKKDDKEIQYL